MSKLNRRTFLKSSLFFSSSLIPINSLRAAKNAHVVIVGAGWGGLSAAKTLRNLNKSVKITIVERENVLINKIKKYILNI